MSGFLQVLTLGALIVVALVVGGVVPAGAFAPLLPINWSNDSPLPMRTGDVSGDAARGNGGGSSGGRSGGGVPAGGYGSVGSAAPVERERERPASRAEERARAERAERLTASRPGCDAPERIDVLAARHEGWDRNDLALIACRKLRDGFTDDQVVAARGRPLRRISPDTAGGMEVWVYRDTRVVLEHDRVVSIRQQ